MDLGGGIWTNGHYDPTRTLPRLKLPKRLDGRTVLDVGAWDGFYSFEMERRGAAKVLATDHFCWGGNGWATQDGFNLAREALGSKVEDEHLDVLDLSPEAVGGTYDIVLFLGVLYHLPNPLLALERVRSVVGGMLVLETEVDLPPVHQAPSRRVLPRHRAQQRPDELVGAQRPRRPRDARGVGFRRAEVVEADRRRCGWPGGAASWCGVTGSRRSRRSSRTASSSTPGPDRRTA